MDSYKPVDEENVLDLRVGQPRFLHPYWNNGFIYRGTPVPIMNGADYPTYEAYKPLEQEIRKLHVKVGNIQNIDDKALVVGAGATQLIYATIAVLKRKQTGIAQVWAPSPYWPRFVNLAHHNGCAFTKYAATADIALYTIPNNPDMRYSISPDPKNRRGTYQIVDQNYNWNTYSNYIWCSDEQISIFGMSKLTGFAGLRLGWALFRDHDLAREVAFEIEVQSSGVSLEAQLQGTNLLETINDQYDTDNCIFKYGAKILEQRWNKVYDVFTLHDEIASIRSDGGMFLYGKSDKMVRILDDAKILHLDGHSTGEPENQSSYFRISLGCSTSEFKEFIQRMKGIKS